MHLAEFTYKIIIKQKGLNKNVGGREFGLIGAAEYRQRPRDSLRRRKIKAPELFGIARNVDQAQSLAFMGLLKRIPKLSDHRVSKDKVKSNPSQKLINRGQVSSALERSKKKVIESKDLRRWQQEILDTVNGRGSNIIHLTPADLEPDVIDSRGKYIGTFIVSQESQHYEQMFKANELALDSLRDRGRADSSDRRSVLVPRIDMYQTPELEIAELTIDRMGQILVANSIDLVLQPARGYKTAA